MPDFLYRPVSRDEGDNRFFAGAQKDRGDVQDDRGMACQAGDEFFFVYCGKSENTYG